MYSIIKFTKKTDLSQYDYVFKDFKEFYSIADFLGLPLTGVYKIAVVTTITKDVDSFIANEKKYSHLSVHIFMEDQALAVVESINPEANFEERVNTYELFKEMIAERSLLFDRYMIYKLYRSIEHTAIEMMNALDMLQEKITPGSLITEEVLSKWFTLNDVIYPSQVLDKFLELDRNRWRMLNKCLTQMDNDVIVGSTVKELKNRVLSKAAYFKTGTAQERVRKMNTSNLLIAYRVFVTERKGINDAFMLYKFYECGTSAVDIKGGQEVVNI